MLKVRTSYIPLKEVRINTLAHFPEHCERNNAINYKNVVS